METNLRWPNQISRRLAMGREGKKGHGESLGEDGNVRYLDCDVYIGQSDPIGHSKYMLFIVL